MSSKPIGVFDSGVGGLTVVRRLRERLPGQTIIFLGDTARVPYGCRSQATIHQYARQDLNFLLRHGVGAVLAACGTVSSIALGDLQNEGIPVCGVLLPAVARAAELTVSGRVGVIATEACIGSGSFQRALAERLPGGFVAARGCPGFVPLAEQGRVQPDDPLVRQTVAQSLASLRKADIDTLILGCTHFPHFWAAISAYMGGAVRLVDAGAAAADALIDLLPPPYASSARPDSGGLECWVTGDPASFSALAGRFLGETGPVPVRQAQIE